jgi:hypothetical protein
MEDSTMWKRIGGGLAAAALLVGGVSGCDDGVSSGDGGPGDGVTQLSLYLTDAPGDVEAVWVEILEIYLQGGPGSPVVLLDEPTELIELTSLVGTVHPLVEDVDIESGDYGQLRMIIGGAVLETVGGDVYVRNGAEHPDGLQATGNLHCPSCSQTGIKVLLRDGDLEFDGDSEDVLLDFDVTESFGRQAGQSGMWVMHPVIHGVRMAEMGRIEGTVALATDGEGEPTFEIPACPVGTTRSVMDFVPRATAATQTDDEGDAIVRTGVTQESGAFTIGALSPDGYDLGYAEEITYGEVKLVWTATVVPGSTSVGVGEVVDGVVYTISGAVCTEVEDED